MNSKKNNIIIIFIFALFELLVITMKMQTMQFLLILFMTCLVIYKARVSFFSELSFILTFSFMQEWIKITFGVARGTLYYDGTASPLGTTIYYYELAILLVTFYITLLLFFSFTKILENEKNLYLINNGVTLSSARFLIIISIILVLLLFPSFPTGMVDIATRRTQGISANYGFMLLALYLAGLTTDHCLKHKEFFLGYFFIVFWTIGHAERVEILGFLSYLGLKILNRMDFSNIPIVLKKRRKKLIYLVGLISILIMSWIGIFRVSGENVSLKVVLANLFLQGTAGDVVHLFNVAADMWKHGNIVHGLTYIHYFFEFIPGINIGIPSDVYLLESTYFSMGGSFFFVEPMMNFGLLGAIFSNITFCFIFTLLLGKSNKYHAYLWIPVVIEIFRTAWYGRYGWILAVFVETPLLFFGITHCLNKIVINKRKISQTNIESKRN